jgi:hypothetical protein
LDRFYKESSIAGVKESKMPGIVEGDGGPYGVLGTASTYMWQDQDGSYPVDGIGVLGVVGDADPDVTEYLDVTISDQNPPVKAAVVGVVPQGGDENKVTRFRDARMLGFLAGYNPVYNGRHAGVYGESDQDGVVGFGDGTGDSTGVYGAGNIGVRGESKDGTAAIQGQSFGTARAGNFIGDVWVDGDLNALGDILLRNRDICERFPIKSPAATGSVMVMGSDGVLTLCVKAYDKSAVGVISGAGDLRPAITLGAISQSVSDAPIALVGTANCLVDAEQGSIEVGDLLTSSNTPGHAMKATDAIKSFGAVIGKALAPLERGYGLIPMVVGLR